MKKVVFSKYSNDRNIKFKIRTDILQDENNRRYVRKVGMTDEGKTHLKTMSEMARQLELVYADSIFETNKASYSDGVLELEYVQGRTLEDMLDTCLSMKKYDKFEKLVTMYGIEMRKLATEHFTPCDEYYMIFGEEAYLPKESFSMRYSNIDMIFANLLENGEKWIVLDYEWTFPITVPIEYILFRTVNYYQTPERISKMNGMDMYKMFGLNEADIPIFQKMEENFQHFVYVGNTPLWKLYGTMGKQFYFPAGMIEARRIQSERKNIEIVRFYDENYKSEYIKATPDESGDVGLDISVDGCNTLRVDPANASCIVYIKRVVAVDTNGETDISYGTNGESSDNRLVYFDTDDPQILIGNLTDDVKMIHVEYNIEFVNKTMLGYLESKNKSFNDMRCENLEKDIEILKQREKLADYDKLKLERDSLQKELEELSEKIQAMENSISWKITKPARNVKARIRR